MNLRRNHILAFAIIGIFLLSSSGHVASVAAQDDVETNFQLLLMTNAGNRIRESYAFFIKQAVAPLGIDVQVLAKPFGQFVGDLLHLSTGQPFDLAIIGFSGGGPYPDFMWKFHSTQTSFGQLMYQLDNKNWQDFQAQDIGVTTAEVDHMLEQIDFELNPLVRRDKINEFAQLYMDKLLYDFPLTTVKVLTAAWKGFGGDQNQLWDPNLGAWASRKLGATWNASATPATRESNSSTLVFRAADPSSPGMFDPYQVFDTSTGAQSDYLTSAMLSYDSGYAPHPEAALQWFVDDITYHNNETGTATATNPDVPVKSGRHTYVLNSNFTFNDAVDYQGNPITGKSLDANDIALALKMFKNPNTNVNGKEQYDAVYNWTISTTYTTNDTIQIYLTNTKPDDYVILGGLTPLPSNILGGDLHMDDPDTTGLQDNGTTVTVDDTGYNPQKSVEWQQFTTQSGISLVGPMKVAEYKYKTDGFWSFAARSDYPFPNENDAVAMYSAGAYDHLNLNTTSDWAGLENFAAHTGVAAQPYFWNYAGFDGTSQGIDSVVVKVIPDTNAALLSFESGKLDFFGSSALGANTVQEHRDNPDYVVKDSLPVSGPTLLVFNLLNPHLQYRDVRYAIASSLDKNEMTAINDGFATPQSSPVWLVYDRFAPLEFKGAGPNGGDLSWYTPYPVEYNYATARDLMRENGYQARDSADPRQGAGSAPVQDIIATLGASLGSNTLIGLSMFAVTATVFIKRKRRYD